MGDCHLPINYTTKPQQNDNKYEENYYKYPIMDEWCDNCDGCYVKQSSSHGGRRRTKSESSEMTSRRKCKEIIRIGSNNCGIYGSPRKYLKCQEYDNMNFELENWYKEPSTVELIDNHNGQNHNRNRVNFCELPTTYISSSNNHIPMAIGLSKTIVAENINLKLCGETTDVKLVEVNNHDDHLIVQHKQNLNPFKHNNLHNTFNFDNHFQQCDNIKDLEDAEFINKSNKTHLDVEEFIFEQERAFSYNTSTYFDKMLFTSSFQESYTKEIEEMRARLAAVRATRKHATHVQSPYSGDGQDTTQRLPGFKRKDDKTDKMMNESNRPNIHPQNAGAFGGNRKEQTNRKNLSYYYGGQTTIAPLLTNEKQDTQASIVKVVRPTTPMMQQKQENAERPSRPYTSHKVFLPHSQDKSDRPTSTPPPPAYNKQLSSPPPTKYPNQKPSTRPFQHQDHRPPNYKFLHDDKFSQVLHKLHKDKMKTPPLPPPPPPRPDTPIDIGPPPIHARTPSPPPPPSKFSSNQPFLAKPTPPTLPKTFNQNTPGTITTFTPQIVKGQIIPDIRVPVSKSSFRKLRAVKSRTKKLKGGASVRRIKSIVDNSARNKELSSSDSESSGGEVERSNTPPQKDKYSGEIVGTFYNIYNNSKEWCDWPVRASLFPNVPPYIKFAQSSEPPFRIQRGRKYFRWELSSITPILVRKTIINTGFIMVRSELDDSEDRTNWLGTWGKHMKSQGFRDLRDFQKLNHIPGTFQLGRKDRLWRNLQKMIHKYGQKEFGFMPQCFILPYELKILKEIWDCNEEEDSSNIWIMKPPAAARGAGIRVINKWSQVPKRTSLVIQRYITNPYLINGNKFDLRLYVLVTSFNPMRIYLYPEGLARFATAKYSEAEDDLKDRYVHLTNYSINKLSSQYAANDDPNACQGHKWTLTKLFEFMHNAYNVNTRQLWRTLQQLVIKTFISAEAPIVQLCNENLLNYYNCYELFGVDVLLDEQLKPWLLEVNISPSLQSSSALDAQVKGPLVKSVFDIAQFNFPSKLSHAVKNCPQPYDPRLYTTYLNKHEREKHQLFVQFTNRKDYLDDILYDLTGDDVRRLIQAEDELFMKGRFERIFPTSKTYNYFKFMETRYYNLLFDAWETRYESNRQRGINLLRRLCEDKVHLSSTPSVTNMNFNKNSPNTIHVESKENLPQQQRQMSMMTTTPMMEAISTASSQHSSVLKTPISRVIEPKVPAALSTTPLSPITASAVA